MHPLPMGELAATPSSLSPFWFIALALGIPALLWLGLAWRRALLECPNRVRRAGVQEMQRLLKTLRRSDSPPAPAHLHAWLRATARVWNVRTSAPCVGEVTQAAHALSGDPAVSSRWRELWQATEHGLYGPDVQPAREWLQHATSVAATIDMPKRQRLFPSRLSHWLPSMAGAVLVVVMFGSQSLADVPWSAPAETSNPTPEELAAEVAEDARAALNASGNDWAAHRNLAAYQTQHGELNLAIAHAAAAFVQHPTGSDTRDVLLAALGETEIVDRNLRQLLAGPWYRRVPTLLSPASWQRLTLLGAIVIAAGFCLMIYLLYSPDKQLPRSRRLVSWTGRGVAAVGTILMVASLASWNAYGAFSHPQAAMLVQNANVSPTPTDLVPAEETLPLSAGSVVVVGRSFLGWRQVEGGREIAGWVRSDALMALYVRRGETHRGALQTTTQVFTGG